MKLYLSRVKSPLGLLLVVTDGEQLCALEYEDDEPRMLKYLQAQFNDLSLEAAKTRVDEKLQPTLLTDLEAYFAGDLSSLMKIPVHLKGTAFQQQVWSSLRKIPVGTTITYGALAAQLGHPQASRAIGMANARNPIAIAIPCHRVIGANAQLTGYAGGLDRKQWLLQHEGALPKDDARQTCLPFLAP